MIMWTGQKGNLQAALRSVIIAIGIPNVFSFAIILYVKISIENI